MSRPNRQIVLVRRPEGAPSAEDFRLVEGTISEPGPGQALVRNLYLSLDPAIRGWMKDVKSYLPPIAIGAPVRSGTLVQIIESNVPGYAPGDICQALTAWEEYSIVDGKTGLHGKVDTSSGMPLAGLVSMVGGNGLTAYFGLLE